MIPGDELRAANGIGNGKPTRARQTHREIREVLEPKITETGVE